MIEERLIKMIAEIHPSMQKYTIQGHTGEQGRYDESVFVLVVGPGTSVAKVNGWPIVSYGPPILHSICSRANPFSSWTMIIEYVCVTFPQPHDRTTCVALYIIIRT